MLKYLPLAILVLALNIFAQSTQSDIQKASEKVETAIELMDNYKLDDAISLLKESIELDPLKPVYQYELAYAYYLKEDYTTAIDILEDVLEMDGINDQYYQMLGNAYDMNGEREKALKSYNNGLEAYPNSGRLYLEIGNITDSAEIALDFYEAGIKADPEFPSNYFHAAKMFCNSTEEVWGVLYGELFMNIERGSDRTVEISKLLFDVYSREIKFHDDSVNISFCQNGSAVVDGATFRLPFGNIFEYSLSTSMLGENSIYIASLNRIRHKFIEYYYQEGFNKTYPNILFDWHKKMIDDGNFEAYNYWLFMKGNEEEFGRWKEANETKFQKFVDWFVKNPLTINDNQRFYRSMYN